RQAKDFSATMSRGQILGLPFDAGNLRVQYSHHRWDFSNSSLELLGGRLLLKGGLSPDDTDLQISGDNLLLANWKAPRGWPLAHGRLSFAGRLTGPWNQAQASGSFWVNGWGWNSSARRNVHGDFEGGPSHGRIEAASDDSSFQLAVEASRDENRSSLDRLDIHLPQGGTVSGQAAVVRQTGRLQGS